MAEKQTGGGSRSLWTGAISFGLVTIPVRLHTAIREKRLSFRSLHDQDKVPLRQKMYCPADGKEVHAEHIVKGYEIEKDRFVVIDDDELAAAAPKASKAIEIEDFVELDEIDPLFFDRPYHVAPKPEGVKPYRLLYEAMEKTGKVAIARVVLWRKQYLCVLRPLDGALCLETMHFHDEVVPAEAVPAIESVETGKNGKVDDRSLKIAQQLIDSLTTKFDASKYHDEYREKVMEIIERKAEGEEIVTRVEEEPHTMRRGQDLVAALEASLASAKQSAGSGGTRNGNGNGNGHNGHSHAAHARHRATRHAKTSPEPQPRRRKSA